MIALYSAGTEHDARLRAFLPDHERVSATDDWGQFERAGPEAECSVVLIECLRTDAALPRVLAYKKRFPGRPVVLATRRNPENLRIAESVPVEEVVWIRDLERGLSPAVGRARTRGFRERLARTFDAADHLPAPLRRALVHACRSPTPVLSTDALARASFCDRTTLWRCWRKAVGADSSLRLEDALHWLVLLRAAGRKVPGLRWSAVADELGVHEDTLARLARQLTGLRLRDFAVDGHRLIARRLTERVLEPLLGSDCNIL